MASNTNKYSDSDAPKVAAVMEREWGLTVTDRAFLPQLPAVAGGRLNYSMGGSLTAKKHLASLGDHAAVALAEGAAATIVDLENEELSATAGRMSTARKYSQTLRAVVEGYAGLAEIQNLVYDASTIWQQTFIQGMISTGVGAATNIDATGVDINWALVRQGARAVMANGGGRPTLICHSTQWGHLQEELAGNSLGDVMTHAPEAYSAVIAQGNGYRGVFYGVDVVVSDKVPSANAGTDYEAVMFSATGLVWTGKKIQQDSTKFQLLLGGGDMEIEFASEALNHNKIAA